MDSHSPVSLVVIRSSCVAVCCQHVDDAFLIQLQCPKNTVGDTEASMSDPKHSSLINRISSLGWEAIDWVGPNVYIHGVDFSKTSVLLHLH